MIKRSCFTSIIAGFVSLLVLTESAPADLDTEEFLENGKFIGNLSPWSVSPAIVDVYPVKWFDDDGDGDGEAGFRPDPDESYEYSALSQKITVYPEFPWLSFDVLMKTVLPGHETDVFTASLGGTELYELLSSDPMVGGVIPVTLNVSDFILAGSVTLEFKLAHDYTPGDSETTVQLDNVALVPIPGALVLGSIGLSLAGCWLGKRRTL
ncbi:MAG: hypothetical protein ISS70_23860 [Phycisphaerae bacterium]|nr:hypothetical protein [Phycisphaerae bacterium]